MSLNPISSMAAMEKIHTGGPPKIKSSSSAPWFTKENTMGLKWPHFCSWAKKGTFFSPTFKVQEKKLLLFDWMLWGWDIYPLFKVFHVLPANVVMSNAHRMGSLKVKIEDHMLVHQFSTLWCRIIALQSIILQHIISFK